MLRFKQGEKLTVKTVEDNKEFSVVVIRDIDDKYIRCIGIDSELNELSMFIGTKDNSIYDLDHNHMYKIKSIKELLISSDNMRERLELVK